MSDLQRLALHSILPLCFVAFAIWLGRTYRLPDHDKGVIALLLIGGALLFWAMGI